MTTMQSNNESAMKPSHDCNPSTQMWRNFTSNVILKYRISKYFKLVELTIVVVLGSVEDEHAFSTITFMKSKGIDQLLIWIWWLECMLKTFSHCRFFHSKLP
jgi:hypothetical protein